jgi:hypothetical protein
MEIAPLQALAFLPAAADATGCCLFYANSQQGTLDFL